MLWKVHYTVQYSMYSWCKSHFFCFGLAVELSSESEPEELDGISELDEIRVDDKDIDDLDKLIAITRSK